MGMITDIVKKQGTRRVLVYMDGALFCHVVKSVFKQRILEIGQEIDEDEYLQWLSIHEESAAHEAALYHLTSRARSRDEVRKFLKEHYYQDATIERILARLQNAKLIDDEDFARQWTMARKNKTLGSRHIAYELRQKGIDADTIEEVIAQIDPEEELQSAITLARKSLAKAKAGEDVRKSKNRAAQALARRGFSWDLIKEALAQASECDEDEGMDGDV